MPKTVNYRRAIHEYLFGGSVAAPFAGGDILSWHISIVPPASTMTGNTTPIAVTNAGQILDSSWRYAKAYDEKPITGWAAISSWTNGARNAIDITFDYVPTGQTWEVAYFIIWVQTSVDTFPIYIGELATPIVLNAQQVMYIPANNLSIKEL